MIWVDVPVGTEIVVAACAGRILLWQDLKPYSEGYPNNFSMRAVISDFLLLNPRNP